MQRGMNELVDKYKVAVVGTGRINKRSRGPAIYCVAGSVELGIIPRAVFLVTEDPKSEGRWLFLPLGCNYSEEPPGLAFSLEGPEDRPKCRFEKGAIYRKADEVLSARTNV